jgi:hypothetical protein
LPPSSRKPADAPSKARALPPLAAPVRWHLQPPDKRHFRGQLKLVGKHLWLFDDKNAVYRVGLDGQVVQTWQLPDSIEQLLVDGDRVHARNRTGTLIDLSSKPPRSVLQLGQLSPVPRLILHRGSQVVVGKKGVITAHDARGKERWSVTLKGASSAQLFCADDDRIYVSAGQSVQALDWSGTLLWKRKVGGAVRLAWQSQNRLYVRVWWEGVHVLDKTGEPVTLCKSDVSFTSGATSEDESLIFTTGLGRLTGWSDAGTKQWSLKFDAGLVCEMCAHEDAIYVVSHKGGLVGVDVSSKALAASARQKLPTLTTRQVSAPAKSAAKTAAKPPRPGASRSPGVGAAPSPASVEVECFQDGKEIRVRVVSKGYHHDWACQFPRALRIAGARYQVDEVAASAKGGFYRVVGGICRLPARP